MGPEDIRRDPHDDTTVTIVDGRQGRPNRWPSMPDDRCEVLLYSPHHDATFTTLGQVGVRPVVDLWAHRTATLGSRSDVEYVVCFENRGAEVGAGEYVNPVSPEDLARRLRG